MTVMNYFLTINITCLQYNFTTLLKVNTIPNFLCLISEKEKNQENTISQVITNVNLAAFIHKIIERYIEILKNKYHNLPTLFTEISRI